MRCIEHSLLLCRVHAPTRIHPVIPVSIDNFPSNASSPSPAFHPFLHCRLQLAMDRGEGSPHVWSTRGHPTGSPTLGSRHKYSPQSDTISVDPNDLYATTTTEEDSSFSVRGEEFEISSIDPFLRIKHKCALPSGSEVFPIEGECSEMPRGCKVQNRTEPCQLRLRHRAHIFRDLLPEPQDCVLNKGHLRAFYSSTVRGMLNATDQIL